MWTEKRHDQHGTQFVTVGLTDLEHQPGHGKGVQFDVFESGRVQVYYPDGRVYEVDVLALIHTYHTGEPTDDPINRLA